MRFWSGSGSARLKWVSLPPVLVMAALLVLGTAHRASADNPRPIDQRLIEQRLSGILARGLDRRVPTERGAMRVIAFGATRAQQGAIFFIHGDPEWHRLGSFSQALRDEENRILAGHLEWLSRLAEQRQLAVYFVARTGVFGSEGESSEFRHEDSYLATGRAIDRVIDMDRIKRAAILGHSGGAAVALTHAIQQPNPAAVCYVLASGVYNIGAMAEFMRIQSDKSLDVASLDRAALGPAAFSQLPPDMVSKFKYFEPLFHLRELPAVPSRLIVAVSDKRDRTVPYFASADLIERLTRLGHRARLTDGAAKPPSHHITYDPAVREATACLATPAPPTR